MLTWGEFLERLRDSPLQCARFRGCVGIDCIGRLGQVVTEIALIAVARIDPYQNGPGLPGLEKTIEWMVRVPDSGRLNSGNRSGGLNSRQCGYGRER